MPSILRSFALRPHCTTTWSAAFPATRADASTSSLALGSNDGRSAMSTKHRRTLTRICRTPSPVDLRWNDVINALKHYSVEVTEREGSRVGFKKDEERIVVYRPHSGPEIGRATVRDIAKFLAAAGAVPSREQDDE